MLPSGDTLYSARIAYPALYVRGIDVLAKLPMYRAAALVAPSSGTFALYKPDGTALVSPAAVTITSSVAQYTVSASLLTSTLTPLGEGWREVWSLTMPDGYVHAVTRTAALAAVALHPVVTDADLTGRYRPLAAMRTGSVSSYQDEIDESWNLIIGRLVAEGRLPYMIRTPDALRMVHLELALATVFDGFGMSAEGSHWREMAKERRAAYEQAWRSMSVQLDVDQDGRVDDPTRRTMGAGAIVVNARPDRYAYSIVLRGF